MRLQCTGHGSPGHSKREISRAEEHPRLRAIAASDHLLGLLVFIGGGALSRLTSCNIEAYPNPAPVILEITAQAAGLSAEEMERYYTIPIWKSASTQTPGVVNIRSTSFYGLSFVRVTFEWGVDYYTAYTRAATEPAAERLSS